MFVYILYRFIICTAIISFLCWLKISATAGYIFKAKIHFSLNIEILNTRSITRTKFIDSDLDYRNYYFESIISFYHVNFGKYSGSDYDYLCLQETIL